MTPLSSFLPELCLTLAAILILLVDLWMPKGKDRMVLNYFAILGILGALASLPCAMDICSAANGQAFGGFLKTDSLAVFFKMIILLGTLFTVLISYRYFQAQTTLYKPEFLAILLFSAAGASAVASAQEIITLWVSLETLTISSYLLASFLKKDKSSNEAGMKYLLLGAFSSAALLLGFSYLYGLTGTTVLADLSRSLAAQPTTPLLVLGVILVIGGLSFKISLAPFHMWTPDVYEGAPTPITAFLSVVSKTAGFAAFTRIFWVGLSNASTLTVWEGLFAVLAVLSIILGNLEAIPQQSLKRLMAYSSIAQAGYIATGFLAGGNLGLTAVLFYLFVYLFANMGVFLAIVILYAKTGSDRIEDVAGVWKRSPLIGVVLLVGLLSLAGVPPFAGFSGKWYLFGAAVHMGYTWLALVGMVFSVISLYYYLQVVRQALISEPKDPSPIPVTHLESAVLLVCIVMTVTLGFWPKPIMDLAQSAAASLF